MARQLSGFALDVSNWRKGNCQLGSEMSYLRKCSEQHQRLKWGREAEAPFSMSGRREWITLAAQSISRQRPITPKRTSVPWTEEHLKSQRKQHSCSLSVLFA